MKNQIEQSGADRNLKTIGEIMDQIKQLEAKSYAI